MRRSVEQRYIFHGNAVALAVQIRRPETQFVPAVASACLPVTGGVANGESEGGRYGEILAFGRAGTKAEGDFITPQDAVAFTNGNHGDNLLPTHTNTRAMLADLNISNGPRRFMVAGLEAAMGSYSDRRRATEFRTLTAEFRGVQLDGVHLVVKTHSEIFTTNPTKQALAQAYTASQEFRDRYSRYFFADKPANARRHAIPQCNGLINTTVVSGLEWQGKAPEGTQIDRNALRISGFGTIYFGELLIEEQFRRLTLLRFELGSPVGGSGSACEVQTNGSSWPPHSH